MFVIDRGYFIYKFLNSKKFRETSFVATTFFFFFFSLEANVAAFLQFHFIIWYPLVFIFPRFPPSLFSSALRSLERGEKRVR